VSDVPASAPVGHYVRVQVVLDPSRLERRRRHRIALGLAWATIAWNTVEAVVAIAAGSAASSIALVGFGLDSTVEVLSASVIVWQMTSDVPEEREAHALRLIAISFFALAGYVTVQAAFDLISGSEPESSTLGIALAAVSLVVMPTLAALKHRNGRRLGSHSVVADSRQTMLCTYLSAVLLIGLLLNAAVGWWWADPLAALVIGGLAFKEGREAWHGERCCDDDACSV
jgi:divalent metal cation (Fe/Co/Zn/Cd) transporter